jgi:hypothetical protein
MYRMETRNNALIPHFIPSILFILSNQERRKGHDRISRMNRMVTGKT